MAMTCNKCSQLFESIIQPAIHKDWQVQMHNKFSELSSFATNCLFCGFCLDLFVALTENPSYPDTCQVRWRTVAPELLQAFVTIGWPDVHESSAFFYILLEEVDLLERTSSTTYQSIRRPIWQPGSTNADARLSLADRWLSNCIKSHPACKKMVSGFPTRLLDLEGVEASRKLRLTATASFLDHHRPSYMTLSHCWGGSQPLKTTKQNLAAHQVSIDLESMPKTFKDAVTVTRRLGCRYLWIDSLCIVQNSREEWEKEAGTMAAIYQNSLLNISAFSASDCHGGLFIDDRDTEAIMVNFDSSSKRRYKVRARKHPAASTHIPGPLAARGWVLQETILAPRGLQFSSHQMFWQCREFFNSEDDIISAGNSTNERINDVTPQDLGFLWAQHAENTSPQLLRLRWQAWADNYSRRKLTHEGDKLPAIAGLIEYQQEETMEQPILGLWSSSLHLDLWWATRSHMPNNKISGIPSWSWLSERLIISYHLLYDMTTADADLENKLQLKRWNVQWSGSPYVSALESWKLVVSGRFLRFKLRTDIENDYTFYPFVEKLLEGESNTSMFLPDIRSPFREGTEFNCLVLFTEGNSVYYLALRPVDKVKGYFLGFRLYVRIGMGKFTLKPDIDLQEFLGKWRLKAVGLV